MNRSDYDKLIMDFCSVCQMEGADSILAGGPVSINDVTFSLNYSEELEENLVLIFCDFGLPAAGREAEVYRALMETNLLLYMLNGPLFSISPDTGRVLFVNRCWLQQLTPVKLRDLLVQFATQAKDWRTHQLLDKPPLRSGQSSTARMLANSLLAKPGS
ncbi:CesT family type III secretion system chaperone [Noviherbaspirillum sp.]|uniref:CesT family type III secretion system chaperone n=1 Tax=Noviherbaspirillum sp. TaxID=1926288 RepID=UPI002FE065A7